ncbi:T9SS type A sorting domain-containing protein, partial [bacterium]|nr:T9SS type A sorting domain-containing protein [bacterium]
LLAEMPQVHWKVGGGDYNIVTMTHTMGDSFTAVIPNQPNGTELYYYIHAEDDSNRSENHPYIGPGNPHHFYVGPDTEPPTITTEIPQTLLPLSLPFPIVTEVRDNRWISSVTLEYKINGIPIDTLEMILQPLSAALYEAPFDPPAVAGDRIQVRIKAVDNSVSQNTTYEPQSGYYTINIVGSIENCIWNPCGMPSGEAIFAYLQGAGIECFYTEDEPVSFNRFENMFVCTGSWPDSYYLTLDQIEKITDYIQSGHRIYLEGTDCWAYSPYHDLLSEAFGIIGIYDGPIQSSVSPLLGVTGTFTSGMSFNSNNSHYVDRIAAAPGAESIFLHADTAYCVAQDAPNYKTIGLSVEFGGLSGNNSSSTKQRLLREILVYFRSNAAQILDSAPVTSLSFIPLKYALYQNFPNPFNPTTAISYSLLALGHVNLSVYDIAGREVATLVDGYRDAGTHEVSFDASALSSGVYVYRLTTGAQTLSGKMVLMK